MLAGVDLGTQTQPTTPAVLSGWLRIRDLAERCGVDAWIAEFSATGLEHRHWTEIVEVCIDSLLRSNLFIVVLYKHAGGPVRLDDAHGFSAASIFEIELLYASLNLISGFFFVVSGYEPESELANLVRHLKLAERDGNWFVGSEKEIDARIGELFRDIGSGRTPAWSLPNFCDLGSAYKSLRQVDAEIRSERLSLIDRFERTDASDFSAARIAHLLDEARKAESRALQLSVLWMALRELAKRESAAWDPETARLWLELSRRLPSAAAWLGLHGPLNLGVMAAYQTQNALRRRGVLPDRSFPYGAFASESYSIGLRHADARWKRLRFRAAERLATRHAREHADDPSGALSIRGSARLRLAALGTPWLVRAALSDFREAHDIKVRLGASDSAIGETLVNRGLAEFAVSRVLWFKRRAALGMLREGLALLGSDPDASRAGFVVSAKRKAADAFAAAGLVDEANREREQAAALARRFGLFDQARRLGNSEP